MGQSLCGDQKAGLRSWSSSTTGSRAELDWVTRLEQQVLLLAEALVNLKNIEVTKYLCHASTLEEN